MNTINLICIGCPLGCPLTVEMEGNEVQSVSGNTCPRGDAYARKELTNPTRIVTSTVRVTGGKLAMASVKTVQDIPKGAIFDCVKALRDVEGIRMFEEIEGVTYNYSYFPIFVDAQKYGESRDELYFRMQKHEIFGRRYFYPLISEFSTYSSLPSASPANLPVATRMANEVICLPMHHELSDEDVMRIINIIKRK